jgi:glycosyltransferase involved in cell wall biosynthesis
MFNSEKYLSACINSVVKQKFNSLEIVLIDDCSSDNTIKISKSFLKKNNNIKIIFNKKNEGVSVCRNKGIGAAKGKYIIFIDSDDLLLNGSLNKLSNFIQSKKKESDMIIFTRYVRKAKNNIFEDEIFPSSSSLVKKYKNVFKLYKNKPVFHTCWSYVFSRDFIVKNKINFTPNINNGEDQLFVSKAFCYSKSFIFYEKSFYCKRLGIGSLSNKIGYKQCFYLIKVINEMCSFANKKNLIGEKKEFMLARTRDPLMEIIPRLVLLKKSEIFDLAKINKLNLKNFKIFKNKIKKKNMIFFIEKYGAFEGLLNYKSFIIDNIKFLVKNKRYKKIFIFSKSFFGTVIAQVLINYKYPIKGFFDNSRVLQKNYISKIKVFSPNLLKYKSSKELSKFFFIISNQKKKDIENITTQLQKYKLNKKQITNIYFHNFV